MDEGRHDQITKLLRETVMMLCKNGVCFERQLRVQGLIGITVDDRNVFLVHINDCISEDGCSSVDEPINSQSSVESLATSHLGADVNEEHQAKVGHWSKTSESSALQYSYVKPEIESSRTVNDMCGGSQNIADVSASVNAGLSSVQETEFVDHARDNDIIIVEPTSGQTSVASSSVKQEASGIWDPYSLLSTASQQEYGLSDYSAKRLSNARSSLAAIQDKTSQYSESLGDNTGYGVLGATHYLNSSMSQQLLQSTPNQSTKMGSSRYKMVRHSLPSESWHVPQISDVKSESATSHQPTTFQRIPVNLQPYPPKRGRPRKIVTTQMPASSEFESSMDDDKWGMVKVTKFACKLCGQTFNHQPNLFRHQITAHGRQKKARGGRPASTLS